MNLSDDTIKKIKYLFFTYRDTLAGRVFFEEVIKILNSDPLFDGYISCVENDNGDYYVDKQSGIFHVDLSFLNEFADWSKNYWKLNCDNKTLLFNYFFLQSILHQAVHIEQYLQAVFKTNEYDAINRMYYDIATLNELQKLREKIVYNFSKVYFSFERNANLESIDLLRKIIIDSDLRELNNKKSIEYLFKGYDITKNGLVSPVESTYRSLGLSPIPLRVVKSIPVKDRILHGLPISRVEYNNIFSPFDGLYTNDIDYNVVKLLMK